MAVGGRVWREPKQGKGITVWGGNLLFYVRMFKRQQGKWNVSVRESTKS